MGAVLDAYPNVKDKAGLWVQSRPSLIEARNTEMNKTDKNL